MKNINEEMLIDYIFELLEQQDRILVENAIEETPEIAEKYKVLRARFSQLSLVNEHSLQKKQKSPKTVLLCTAAAALLVFIFLPTSPIQSQTAATATAAPEKVDSHVYEESRAFSLQRFVYEEENFSLPELDTSLFGSVEIEIPEVKISYDNEDYEIVDLKDYINLQLPTEPSKDLINPNLILISYIQ